MRANGRVSHIVHVVVKQVYYDTVIVVACHQLAHLASLAEVIEPEEVGTAKTGVLLVVIWRRYLF